MMKSKIKRLTVRIDFGILLGAIFIVVLVFNSCSRTPTDDPMTVTSKFIRSFVTADTVLFYSVVDADSIVDYMNRAVWHRNDDIYVVRQILFFKYAPWKLNKENLQERIAHPFPYSYFEFDNIHGDAHTIRAIVKWREIYDDSLKHVVVQLYERQPGIWKIKAIDFTSDSLKVVD